MKNQMWFISQRLSLVFPLLVVRAAGGGETNSGLPRRHSHFEDSLGDREGTRRGTDTSQGTRQEIVPGASWDTKKARLCDPEARGPVHALHTGFTVIIYCARS